MVHDDTTFFNDLKMGHRALSEGNAGLAFECWSRCQSCMPPNIDAYRHLAHSFRAIGHLAHARCLLQAALSMAPDDPVLQSDLANLLIDRGESDTAIEMLVLLANSSEAAGDTENALGFLGNALMAMEYSPGRSTYASNTIAQKWEDLASTWAKAQITRIQIPERGPELEAPRPLRVGFISGDLCDHPVGFLLLPVLQNRNPTLWRPYLYDNGSRQDRTHQQLRACVADQDWHTVGTLDDSALMKKILDDRLDVLVDLSGHSGKSRLRVMAYRLAGKQLSWLGFSATTGLPTMDGVILDGCIAEGASDQFCEQILEINPSRFCFRPPFAPPLAQPPCLLNGFITFGCFNNTAKYNAPLFNRWAQILNSTPNSRLILKWRTFADPVFCEETIHRFTALGIDAGRLTLSGFTPHRQMLDEYNTCDIALDTFPFNGGYTSLEALWMGLPLVTLPGDTPISRQSASFLNVLGRQSWIAPSAEAYVSIAVELARETDLLSEVRQRQRFEMMDSELYDAALFTHRFEVLIQNQVGH